MFQKDQLVTPETMFNKVNAFAEKISGVVWVDKRQF